MLGATLIDIPAWGNMNLLEVIWIASGVGAMVITAMHMGGLNADYQAAQQVDRPALTVVAFAYLRREVVRFAQGVALTIVGIWAATQPSPFGQDVVTVTTLVITGVLFSIAFLISVQSIWDWRDRKVAQALLDAGKNGH